MDTKEKLELIESLISEVQQLPFRAEAKLDKFERRAEMILRNLYGDQSKYLKDLKSISFYPGWVPSEEGDKRKYWQSGIDEMLNLFNTLKEEHTLFVASERASKQSDDVLSPTNKVFIVHGRDNEMKLAVARTLEKLGLHPIILHEQPNQGRTIYAGKMDSKNGLSVLNQIHNVMPPH